MLLVPSIADKLLFPLEHKEKKRCLTLGKTTLSVKIAVINNFRVLLHNVQNISDTLIKG